MRGRDINIMELPTIHPRYCIVSKVENTFALAYYDLIKDVELSYEDLFLLWTRCIQYLLESDRSSSEILKTQVEKDIFALFEKVAIESELTLPEQIMILSKMLYSESQGCVKAERKEAESDGNDVS